MSAPSKDNRHILAEPGAFMESYERARAALVELPGVVGVAFGHKQVSGAFTDDVALVVFVKEKKAEADLPAAQRIPPSFEGYRTDVRLTLGSVAGACNDDTSHDIIQGGIQIETEPAIEFGTLGCIVHRRADSSRDNVFLLTNSHVLFTGSARAGNVVFHPYAPPIALNRVITGLGPIQDPPLLDNFQSTVPGANGQPPVQDTFFIDCATARIDIDSKCCGTRCTKDQIKCSETILGLQLNNVDTIKDVRSIARDPSIVVPRPGTGPPHVFKVGRTTGKTQGVVRSVNATLNRFDKDGHVTITGQNVIELEFDPTSTPNGLNCRGNPFMAEHGDSGALVVDDQGRAIGLLSDVPDPTLPGGRATSTAACHILPVLDKLQVCIVTAGGTSHGSCGATDGSGIVPVGQTAQAEGDGTLQGAGAAALGSAVPADFPEPAPVSAAEQQRMTALLRRFLATPAGPELYEIFGYLRREAGYLVRNVRPVKVCWHRGEGPAYMAHLIKHLKGMTSVIPERVNGVERSAMLGRMADLLAAHGSIRMREGIERWRPILLPILSSATAEECIERLAGIRPGNLASIGTSPEDAVEASDGAAPETARAAAGTA